MNNLLWEIGCPSYPTVVDFYLLFYLFHQYLKDLWQFDKIHHDKHRDLNNLNHLDFLEFTNWRKKDADAIAQMALENFEEMQASVVDEHFLKKKKLSQELQESRPNWITKYEMVTFTSIPYSQVVL